MIESILPKGIKGRRVTPESLCQLYDKQVVVKKNGCWGWNGSFDRDGYPKFSGLFIRAHRFSYARFVGDIPKGMLACHRCNRRECTRPDHIFLGTPADNSHDMVRKHRSAKGEMNPFSKLTEDKVIEIRKKRAAGASVTALAKEYGFHKATISQTCTRVRWKHVP